MADNPHLFLLLPHFAGDPDPPPSPPPPPLWSPPFASLSSSAADLDTASDYSDDDLASLSLDLFRRRPRSPSHNRPFIPPVFWSHNDLEELERPGCLGLDSVFDGEEDESETVDIADRGLIVPDWTSDDFFVGLRRCPSDSTEFSRARPLGEGGLRVTGIDSDSDSDEQIVAMFHEQMAAAMGMDSDDGVGQYGLPDEFDVPLRWDTLQLGDGRRDVNEGFEWEEIDGQDEESDTIDIMVLGHDVRSDESRALTVTEVEDEAVVRNVDWQILLAMNDLGRSPLDPDEVGAYFEDQDGLVYASDYEPYEVLFGQLSEQNSNTKGSPPAAKSVIENLPSVVLRKEDTTEIDAVCAVCKDGIQAEEQVKRLPCLHHYHEDCILPWLGIRNTCPLCRFELPTDDPEYEKRKARRANGVISLDESQLRYDFEMLPEASIL